MKVLVPIDGSRNALKAVSHAGYLASLDSSMEIVLMYVVTFEPRSPREAAYMEKQISSNGANDILEQAQEQIQKEAPTASISQIVSRGVHAADEILRCAESGSFDMIIMGTRGLSNVQRFLMGSVSSQVSQYAPCTVTLVK